MTPQFQVDLREFSATLDRALRNSSRELSVAINARMYFLMSKALNATKRASEQDIRKLGLYSFQKYKRDGTLAKKARNVQDVSASTMSFIRIHQKRNGGFIRGRFGNRAEVTEAARKWIAGKIKAIGFLASLWIPAIRRFDRYASQKASRIGAVKRTPNQNVKGIGKPAKPGFSPVSEGGFIVGVDRAGNSLRTYAQTLLHQALGTAMRQETDEMKRHLEAKIKESLRRSGVEVHG